MMVAGKRVRYKLLFLLAWGWHHSRLSGLEGWELNTRYRGLVTRSSWCSLWILLLNIKASEGIKYLEAYSHKGGAGLI
jgi:hypothetical protein